MLKEKKIKPLLRGFSKILLLTLLLLNIACDSNNQFNKINENELIKNSFNKFVLLYESSFEHKNKNKIDGNKTAIFDSLYSLNNRFVSAHQIEITEEEKLIHCKTKCIIIFSNGSSIEIKKNNNEMYRVDTHKDMVLTNAEEIQHLRNLEKNKLQALVVESLITPLNENPPGPSKYEIEQGSEYNYSNTDDISVLFNNDFFQILQISISGGSFLKNRNYLSGIIYFPSLNNIKLFDTIHEKQVAITNNKFINWVDSSEYIISADSETDVIYIGLKPIARYASYEP